MGNRHDEEKSKLESCTLYFEELLRNPPPNDDPIWELFYYLENPRTRSHCRFWLENFDKFESTKEVFREFLRQRRDLHRNARTKLLQMLEQVELATHRLSKQELQIELGVLVKQARRQIDPAKIESLKSKIHHLETLVKEPRASDEESGNYWLLKDTAGDLYEDIFHARRMLDKDNVALGMIHAFMAGQHYQQLIFLQNQPAMNRGKKTLASAAIGGDERRIITDDQIPELLQKYHRYVLTTKKTAVYAKLASEYNVSTKTITRILDERKRPANRTPISSVVGVDFGGVFCVPCGGSRRYSSGAGGGLAATDRARVDPIIIPALAPAALVTA